MIDFSPYAATLAQTTAWFARALHADVVLMHQVGSIFPAFSDTESRRQVIEKEKAEALHKLEALAQSCGLAQVQYAVGHEPLNAQLQELKANAYFDWVLLGLKGTGLLKQLFIGSTALEVIENSGLLSVALPKSTEVVVPHRLVVAVSENFPLNRGQLQQVVSSLKEEISAIEFITIDTGDEAAASETTLRELQQAFSQYNSSYHTFEGKNALDAIKEHMRQNKDAYLVVQRGSRTFDDSVLRRFMINELVYSASVPMVVLG